MSEEKKTIIKVDVSQYLDHDQKAWDRLEKFYDAMRRLRSLGHVSKLMTLTMLREESLKRELAIMVTQRKMLRREQQSRIESMAEELPEN